MGITKIALKLITRTEVPNIAMVDVYRSYLKSELTGPIDNKFHIEVI